MSFEQFKELLIEINDINNNLDSKYINAFNKLLAFNCKKNNTNNFKEMITILKSPTEEDFENFKSFLKE